jgi:hypothetical protein
VVETPRANGLGPRQQPDDKRLAFQEGAFCLEDRFCYRDLCCTEPRVRGDRTRHSAYACFAVSVEDNGRLAVMLLLFAFFLLLFQGPIRLFLGEKRLAFSCIGANTVNSFTTGMGALGWILIILFFLRKRSPWWTTGFRVFAWIFGFSFFYYSAVEQSHLVGFYTLVLIAIAVICFVLRNKGQTWKIGFFLSLLYLIHPIVGLILALKEAGPSSVF